MREEAILKESFDDIRQDFTELLYIIASDQEYLRKFISSLKKNKNHILPKSLEWIEKMSSYVKKELNQYHEELIVLRKKTQGKNHSLSLLSQLTKAKKAYFDILRTQQGVFTSLITATDWQSPSYAHSLYSQAGVQTGKIIGTINDYKRDQHLNEKEFENAYLSEYIDSRFKFLIKVYATDSGMAAFTTILNFLVMEGKIEGKVLLGRSSYFENKELVHKLLKDKVIEVDESNTSSIIETIKKEKPSVLFFDSLCNVKDIPTPNLSTIISYVVKSAKEDIYIVIDNSCLSVFFQPWNMVIGRTTKVHLILFESLNKYLQFGLDRTTGGIIVALGKDNGKLFSCREHLGTNISDTSVYMIPKPNRRILEKRLLRLNRNMLFLSQTLEDFIRSNNTEIERVIRPDISFSGSFFTLGFKNTNIRHYKRFVQRVIDLGRKRKIDLVAGTSFGLSTTRIYVTASRTSYVEPFVRISSGTENRWEMERLKDLFCEAIATF